MRFRCNETCDFRYGQRTKCVCPRPRRVTVCVRRGTLRRLKEVHPNGWGDCRVLARVMCRLPGIRQMGDNACISRANGGLVAQLATSPCYSDAPISVALLEVSCEEVEFGLAGGHWDCCSCRLSRSPAPRGWRRSGRCLSQLAGASRRLGPYRYAAGRFCRGADAGAGRDSHGQVRGAVVFSQN